MKYRLFIVISVLLLLVNISNTIAQNEEVPRFEMTEECFVSIPDGFPEQDCGYVIVPEFHQQPDGDTLSLGVIRVKSLNQTPGAPIVFAAGGPGGNSTAGAVADTAIVADLLTNHDLIFYDQRGTLNSSFLNCTELFQAQVQALTEGIAADLRQKSYDDAIESCHSRYVAEGIDFAAYNSVESAADVDAIREAFSYDKIILHGRSYGTILAQHVMRDFPEILEAVILDGSFGLDEQNNWITTNSSKVPFVFDHLFDTCANDPACIAAYPDSRGQMNELIAQLRDNPVKATTADTGSGATDIVIDDVWAIRAFSYMTQIPQFRSQLLAYFDILTNPEHPAYSGAMQNLATIIGLLELGEPSVAFMMHFAVACSEDPVYSLQSMLAFEGLDPAVITYGLQDAENYIYACRLFDVPVLPEEDRVNAPSDIPVLFLNGGYDNATPTYMNEALAESYPNSFSFTFPNGYHIQTFNSEMYPCLGQILQEFTDDPTTEPDGSCIADLPLTSIAVPG